MSAGLIQPDEDPVARMAALARTAQLARGKDAAE
jgi:hypothetical protein